MYLNFFYHFLAIDYYLITIFSKGAAAIPSSVDQSP